MEINTGQAWPPNVREFRLCCLSEREDLRLLSAARAFQEVKNNLYCSSPDWSNAAIYWAVQEVGVKKIREGDVEAYREFSDKYESFCQRIINGDPLEIPKNCAIRDVDNVKVCDREKAEFYLRKIKAILGSK